MQYRPKEILIMEALLHKVCEGKEISQLRVQEIATAAGVGKGTIYEYFTSKDEIVERSILYSLDKELQMLEQVIEEAADFNTLLHQILEFISNTMKDHKIVYHILLQNRGRELEACIHGEHMEVFRQYYEHFMRLQDRIVARGKQEHQIDDGCKDDFCRYVIHTALMGIAGSGFMELQDHNAENALVLIQRCIGTESYRKAAEAANGGK